MNHMKKRKTVTYYEWCKIASLENPVWEEWKRGGIRNRNIYNAMLLMKKFGSYGKMGHLWPPARMETIVWKFKKRGASEKKYAIWTMAKFMAGLMDK